MINFFWQIGNMGISSTCQASSKPNCDKRNQNRLFHFPPFHILLKARILRTCYPVQYECSLNKTEQLQTFKLNFVQNKDRIQAYCRSAMLYTAKSRFLCLAPTTYIHAYQYGLSPRHKNPYRFSRFCLWHEMPNT